MVSTGTRVRNLALLKLDPKHRYFVQATVFMQAQLGKQSALYCLNSINPKKRNVKYSLCFPHILATYIQFSMIENAH
jgi:hypothetical protein